MFLTDTAEGLNMAESVGVNPILMMNDPDESRRLAMHKPAGGIVSLPAARLHPNRASGKRQKLLIRQRVRPHLESDDFVSPFSSLTVERRACTPGGPDSLPFPAGLWIVNRPSMPFAKKPSGYGTRMTTNFPFTSGIQRIRSVAGDNGSILAEPQRIKLVHPVVVMRIGAARFLHVLEVRTGRGIQRPAFRTMLTGSSRAVERTFAFAAVEARQVPASQRNPDDIVAIIEAARRKNPHLALGLFHGTS